MSIVSGLDTRAIKTRQQQTWASGDYASIAARIHPIAERLCEAADLPAGWAVLDVATGTGNAALAAARCGCDVVGVDYVPELLERGRVRARAEGLRVEFVTGDAEDLPFPDGAFDAVLSTVGVMFAPDQEQAAAELVRVCRPGGRIALAAWTPDGFLGELLRTIGRHVPPPPGVRPPVQWGSEERLAELFGDSVSSVATNVRTHVFRYRSAAEFVECFRTRYGPVLKAFEALEPAGRDWLAEDLTALVRRGQRGKGDPVAIPAEYLETVATRRAG
jgi:ubiquinone/menaquinone biosynthesis C-methylase UbiE